MKIVVALSVLFAVMVYCEAIPMFEGEPKHRMRRGIWDQISGTFSNIDFSQMKTNAAQYKERLMEFARQHRIKESLMNLGSAGMQLSKASIAKLNRLLNGENAGEPVVIAQPPQHP
uniref:Cathepsin propeptide inhibitor domain-containing protein n=1 Tax=Ciona savignyi TaxID=51511 RepID=H2ZBH7_CIOSA